jgi:hypothetical protein
MEVTLALADGGKEPPVVLEISGNPLLESEFLIGRAHDCDGHI